MSEPGSIHARERSHAHEPPPSWRVRGATAEDIPAIAGGVRELLLELGGTPSPAYEIEVAARALLEDPDSGTVLVAEAEGAVVGILGASWQSAMHVPGRYAVIQDLWVAPPWRSRTIGHDLLDAFFELARTAGSPRVEVGLPREDFARIAATEAFYRANGFTHLGPRMRRLL
jgi:GNAT superfamily N-acetyltransferase